jgi:hypothetical protein
MTSIVIPAVPNRRRSFSPTSPAKADLLYLSASWLGTAKENATGTLAFLGERTANGNPPDNSPRITEFGVNGTVIGARR